MKNEGMAEITRSDPILLNIRRSLEFEMNWLVNQPGISFEYTR